MRLGSTFQQQETRDLPYYPVLFLTIPVTCGYHHAQVTGLACGYYHAQAFGSPAGITTLRSPASTVDKYLYGNFSFVRCLEVLTHQTAAISLFSRSLEVLTHQTAALFHFYNVKWWWVRCV